MRHRLAGATVAALLAAASHACAQPPAPPDPPLAERAFIAARLHTALATDFAHADALPADFDLDAAFRRFLDPALAAPTRLDFDRAAMRFLASFGNGQTRFLDLATPAPPLPFRARRIAGRWIVTASALPPTAPTLNPGDELAALDGQPFDAWARGEEPVVRGSDARETETNLLDTPILWPERFQLRLAGGAEIPVDRTVPAPGPWRGRHPPVDVDVSEPRPGLVLIRIPSFADPAYERAAVEAVARHADARALLLDLRGNAGGNTPAALLDALITTPYRDMIGFTPMHLGVLDARQKFGDDPLPDATFRFGGQIVAPDRPLYAGRLVVLSDAGCTSSCEDVLLALRHARRATIVGETSAGSIGQPELIDFPEAGMRASIGAKREVEPDLTPFEGIGVVPDITVADTQADLRAGRDPALARAIAIATSPPP